MIICFMGPVVQEFHQSIGSKLIKGIHPCGQDSGYNRFIVDRKTLFHGNSNIRKLELGDPQRHSIQLAKLLCSHYGNHKVFRLKFKIH